MEPARSRNSNTIIGHRQVRSKPARAEDGEAYRGSNDRMNKIVNDFSMLEGRTVQQWVSTAMKATTRNAD